VTRAWFALSIALMPATAFAQDATDVAASDATQWEIRTVPPRSSVELRMRSPILAGTGVAIMAGGVGAMIGLGIFAGTTNDEGWKYAAPLLLVQGGIAAISVGLSLTIYGALKVPVSKQTVWLGGFRF
jgi:hypothetical protein